MEEEQQGGEGGNEKGKQDAWCINGTNSFTIFTASTLLYNNIRNFIFTYQSSIPVVEQPSECILPAWWWERRSNGRGKRMRWERRKKRAGQPHSPYHRSVSGSTHCGERSHSVLSMIRSETEDEPVKGDQVIDL